MMNRILLFVSVLGFAAFPVSAGFGPVYLVPPGGEEHPPASSGSREIRLFQEGVEAIDKTEKWPDSVAIGFTETEAHEGDVSALVRVPAKTSAEARFGFPAIDLSQARRKGAIVFYYKGAVPGQKFSIALRTGWDQGGYRNSPGKSFTVTSDWQKAVLPLTLFGDKGSFWDDSSGGWKAVDFDWTRVAYLEVSPDYAANQGVFQIWLDDIIIDPAYSEHSAPDPEIVRVMMLRLAEKNPAAFFDRNVVMDFEEDSPSAIAGWKTWDRASLPAFSRAEAADLPVGCAECGSGVLAAELDLKVSSEAKASFVFEQEQNWSGYTFVEFDVLMPAEGPKLTLQPFVSSGGWKWSQSDPATAEIEPGKWTRIRYGLHTLPGLEPSSVQSFGFQLLGKVKEAYQGSFYVDNWTFYTKDLSPVRADTPRDTEFSAQTFGQIELGQAANRPFTASGDSPAWLGRAGEDFLDWSTAQNEKIFLGVPFKLESRAVVLRGRGDLSVTNRAVIDVGNRPAAGLYFLHAADSWTPSLTGSYSVEYEDGSVWMIELQQGRQVWDWWNGPEFFSPQSRVVHAGKTSSGREAGLTLYAWKNPMPEKRIARIIAETPGDGAYLMLVGLTLTDKGPFLLQNE